MSEHAASFRARYGTALIADAAFRAGAPCGALPRQILPLDDAHKLAGPAVTVAAGNDLVAIMVAVHRAAEGDVVVIGNATPAVGLIGDVIATEAARKGLAGFVVDGCVRDKIGVLATGVPVFCRGTVPVGPLKVDPARRGIGSPGVPLRIGEVRVTPGQWLCGDADGVLVVEAVDLDAIMAGAGDAWQREELLQQQIRGGESLGELLRLEAFLDRRAGDPQADFNAHLRDSGRAI